MTRTPLSRSKGQRSTCWARGILWRPSAQLSVRRLTTEQYARRSSVPRSSTDRANCCTSVSLLGRALGISSCRRAGRPRPCTRRSCTARPCRTSSCTGNKHVSQYRRGWSQRLSQQARRSLGVAGQDLTFPPTGLSENLGGMERGREGKGKGKGGETTCLTSPHWLLPQIPPYCGVLTPLKYARGVRECFDPAKNVTFFHSKLLSCNSASFTSLRMKDLCQKWKVKLIFEAPTGCQEPRLLNVRKSLTHGVI